MARWERRRAEAEMRRVDIGRRAGGEGSWRGGEPFGRGGVGGEGWYRLIGEMKGVGSPGGGVGGELKGRRAERQGSWSGAVVEET